MAPSILDIIEALPSGDTWGPPTTTETLLNGVPYAPFSKGDKLGRMADWTAEGKDREGRGGRQYNRAYRDAQVYGAGTSSLFAVQGAEDESSFSVVDNTRASAKRGFGRGGGTVFRGRGRGGPQQRGGRGAAQTNSRGGRGGQQGQYDQRNQRGGRGGRRFGYRDYDKPQRTRDASVNIKPDWTVIEEIDFNRLHKLNLDTGNGEDLDSQTYGFLYYYDRTYDKPPLKNVERKLNTVDRAFYNVTTSQDPVILDLAEKNEATIFATDNILSMLMCSTRSVYSWDIVITKQGNKLFLDKRDGTSIDTISVNENAADAPLDASEGNKELINTPNALAEEAASINHWFANQTVKESETSKHEFENDNPFYIASEDTDPPASKGYRYRRFDLSLNQDEDPLHLIVRTEVDSVSKNNISGEDQFMTLKALNEFDNKAQGSGGALDWRSKLTSQRGAVLATEMKNNSCKLARWTTQSILARADQMKLGFVSRVNPKVNDKHVILGVVGFDPKKFADQMGLNLNNGWGVVRTIIDMCLKMSDGKYVLVKDPNKPMLRLYEVPVGTFEEGDEEEAIPEEPETEE